MAKGNPRTSVADAGVVVGTRAEADADIVGDADTDGLAVAADAAVREEDAAAAAACHSCRNS